MRSWIVIPVKAPEACKTRLASVLDDRERKALVAAMVRRVVVAARAVVGPEQVLLLGPSRHGLDLGTPLLTDPGGGLNAAAGSALDAARQSDLGRLLLLSADLPLVGADDVSALLDVDERAIAIGLDRSGQGTNALSLPLPAAANFHFQYGKGSGLLHEVEAARVGLPFLRIARAGLSHDIDRPQDIVALNPLLKSLRIW